MPFCVQHRTNGGPCNPKVGNGFFKTYWVNDDTLRNEVFQLATHRAEQLPLIGSFFNAQAKSARSEHDINVDQYRILLVVEPFTCIASATTRDAIVQDWDWLEANVMPAVRQRLAEHKLQPLSQTLLEDIFDGPIMAQAVRDIVAHATAKKKTDEELNQLLRHIKHMSSCTSVISLQLLQKQLENDPECQVKPRDHMLPSNVALQFCTERIDFLKRSVFADLQHLTDNVLFADCMMEFAYALRSEVEARVRLTRNRTSQSAPSATATAAASTASPGSSGASAVSVQSDAKVTNAKAGAWSVGSDAATRRQQIAMALSDVLNDPDIRNRATALLNPATAKGLSVGVGAPSGVAAEDVVPTAPDAPDAPKAPDAPMGGPPPAHLPITTKPNGSGGGGAPKACAAGGGGAA